MKDFLKKLCYYDHPAEGAFAAETFLLLLPGIALALYLLCGGSLFDRKFVFGFFLSWPVLPSIRLIIELAVLLTLTAWFSFYRREVMQNKKTALFLCAVILIAVLYGYCGGPLPWLAIFLILLTLTPLVLIYREWKVILLRGACLIGAAVCLAISCDYVLIFFRWVYIDRFLHGDIGLERVNLELLTFSGMILLLGGYLLSGLMYARAAKIPFRNMFGLGIRIMWGLVAAIYLVSLGMAFVTSAKADHAVKELEEHFAKSFSASDVTAFYRNGRKVDADFWKKVEAVSDAVEKNWKDFDSRGPISSSPECIYPPEVLKEFEILMSNSASLRELETLFDGPLPARKITYETRYMGAVLLPELNWIREFCRWELWRIRFAAERKDLPGAIDALKRMEFALDYLVNKPSSLIATLVMMGCERYRMQGMEVLLSSGIVTEPVLKQWQSGLERADRKIPQLNFDCLYLEAAMMEDTCQSIAHGGDFFGARNPSIYKLRWLYPPMWYYCAKDRYNLLRHFQVRKFGEMPDVKHKYGLPADYPVSDQTQQKFDRLSAMYRTMRALIGVELEKRRTGKYPDTLANPPVDPFTGKPMLYRKGRITVNDPVWIGGRKKFDNKAVRQVNGIEIISAGPNRKNDVGARMIFKQGSAN